MSNHLLRACYSTPSKVAYIDWTTELTYADLLAKASQVAFILAPHIKRGQIVFQILPKSKEMIIGMVAVYILGAIYCPLHPKDPQERFKTISNKISNYIILTQSSLKSKWSFSNEDNVFYIDQLLQMTDPCEYNPFLHSIQDQELLYILSTSGSTGEPKLVAINYSSVLNLTQGLTERVGWSANERILQLARCTFDAQILETYVVLLLGATIIMTPEDWNYSLPALHQWIDKANVTSMFLVPSVVPSLEKAFKTSLNKVQSVILGGEAVHDKVCQTIRQIFPNANQYVGYGPTETCVFALMYPLDSNSFTKHTSPIGFALPNYHVQIVKEDPSDELGELYISGKGVMREYYLDPNRTNLSVVQNEEGRWYKTGDLVLQESDGCIYYKGRKDHQVKINGQRMELGEIEHVLRKCSNIKEAVVVKVINSTNNDELIAYVQASEWNPAELREHCLRMLPPYMIPIKWIAVESFSLTPSGKIDRKALQTV